MARRTLVGALTRVGRPSGGRTEPEAWQADRAAAPMRVLLSWRHGDHPRRSTTRVVTEQARAAG